MELAGSCINSYTKHSLHPALKVPVSNISTDVVTINGSTCDSMCTTCLLLYDAGEMYH